MLYWTAEPAILDHRVLSGLISRNTIAGGRLWNAQKRRLKLWDQWIDDIKDGQTRCVFRMFYKQGMTWKTIAKQIGMPHNEGIIRECASVMPI